MKKFSNYTWPGNLLELYNELERSAIMSDTNVIDIEHLSENFRASATSRRAHEIKKKGALPKLRTQIEKEILVATLKETKGDCRLAATRLKIPKSSFYRKLKKYGISKSQPHS